MNIILLSPNSLKIQNSLCHYISITLMCSLQAAILGGIHFISPTACFLSPAPTHMYTHTYTQKKGCSSNLAKGTIKEQHICSLGLGGNRVSLRGSSVPSSCPIWITVWSCSSVLLERASRVKEETTPESPPHCKEIKPVNPRGINPAYSSEGLRLKLHYFDHLMRRLNSQENTLILGKDWRQKGEEPDRGSGG